MLVRPQMSLEKIVGDQAEGDDFDGSNESWAGWAWNLVPSIMPYYFEEEWSNDQQVAYAGHTYHTGFYVERASVSLKVTESLPDRSYYGPRKVKFIPFLTVQLQGCFMDFIMHGAGWLNVQLGVGQASVQPYEAILLEKSPAFALDYLYMLEMPEDFSSERFNLSEKSLCRIVVGPTAVKVCSGLLHRLQMVHHYAKVYDYSPYSTPKPEPTLEQLHPATTEDFEALDQNIPKQVFQLTLFKPVIHVILADHPVFDPKKLPRIQPLTKQIMHLPKVTLECECLDARVVKPMYPRRLIFTTCQLPTPPQHMFQACHFHTNIKVSFGVEYLELCVEEMSYRRVMTPGTEAYSLILGTMKAFVLEFPLSQVGSDMLPEPQQALVLSGPDNAASGEAMDTESVDVVQQPLLNLTLQCTRDPKNQDHPPVLIFNLREVRACVDPMMWQWLRYAPTRVSTRHDLGYSDALASNGSTVHRRSRKLSSESSVGMEPSLARRAPTPQESVHSSSDRDQMLAQTGPSLSPVAHSRGTHSESGKQASASTVPEQESKWTRNKLLHWFPVWRGLVLSGDMAQCVVYLPTASLSAVGAQSIEDALTQCLRSTPPPEVLVLTFPFLTLRSAVILMANVLVGLLEFASSLQFFSFSYADIRTVPVIDPAPPASPTVFPESSGSRESPTTPLETEESNEQRKNLHFTANVS
ncbi:hypothetical protein C0J52_23171 [Blattella germanica]|nr:hypothetical protein C0J52_23171 [Blattella germanica]